MFVLTPPSERTPLNSVPPSLTYSSSQDDLILYNNTSNQYEHLTHNYWEKINFNCCKNITSLILSSINDITYWKLLLFCVFEWNFYTTMKIIYPFNEYFASYYGIPMTQFSYITSSYDFGSFIAILFMFIPCIPFAKISIRISLCLIFILNGITQLLHTLSTSFNVLFILRLINGMLGALAWSQITGSIGAFLKSKNMRTYGIIIHESSSLLSTLSFVPIGYILYHYSIDLCWKILSGMSFICAIISFCVLPKISVYNASNKSNKQIMNYGTNQNRNMNDSSLYLRNTTLSKFKRKYHLYLLYLTAILTEFPYIMFYTTFGSDLTHRFNLNVQKLGLETLTLNLGELTALIFTLVMIRYYSNSFCVLFGSFGIVFVSVFYAIILDINHYNEIVILIFIYFLALFRDIIILNSIICMLHFSPNGYESICSLVFLLVMNLSSMIATILGSNIVNKTSFAVLARINAIIFLIQLLVAWAMMTQRNVYQRALRRRYSISITMED